MKYLGNMERKLLFRPESLARPTTASRPSAWKLPGVRGAGGGGRLASGSVFLVRLGSIPEDSTGEQPRGPTG